MVRFREMYYRGELHWFMVNTENGCTFPVEQDLIANFNWKEDLSRPTNCVEKALATTGIQEMKDEQQSEFAKVIPNWNLLTRNQKKSKKRKYKEKMKQIFDTSDKLREIMKLNINPINIDLEKVNIILDRCCMTQTEYDYTVKYIQKQEEDKTMTNMNTTTMEVQQRSYLSSRLRSIYSNKQDELARAFGIQDDEPPFTPKELVERIKNGQFVLEERREDIEDHPRYLIDYLRWRDPAKKADKEGLKAAKKKLEKAWTDTQDIISIKSVDEGLKAVQEFETATFH